MYTILLLKRLRKLTNHHSYDRDEFFWALFLALTNATINTTRPENFVAHTIVTVLAVFALVIAIHNRFINQLIIIHSVHCRRDTGYCTQSVDIITSFLYSVFSMIIANGFAVSSWLLHFWRRREFLTCEEIQKARVEAEMQLAERKKAEEALQKNLRHTKKVLNSISDSLFVFDNSWRYIYQPAGTCRGKEKLGMR
jgi:PAS domain-containing protein